MLAALACHVLTQRSPDQHCPPQDPSVDILITSERFEFSLGWGGFFGLGEEAGLEGLSYLVGFDEPGVTFCFKRL